MSDEARQLIIAAQQTEIHCLLTELSNMKNDWNIRAVELYTETDRLRAELANANDAADKWRDLFFSDEAAIRRVRELCNESWRGVAAVAMEQVRAAIEGNGR